MSNQNTSLKNPALTYEQQTLYCEGEWIISNNLTSLLNAFKTLVISENTLVIHAGRLKKLDTAGAWILLRLSHALEKSGKSLTWKEFSPKQADLLKLVRTQATVMDRSVGEKKRLTWIAQLGQKTVQQCQQAFAITAFLGEICINLLAAVRHIWQIQWRSLLNVIDEAGYRALGIVGLLCALIGVVIAYQMGQQLKIYGANIYIISFLGIGILQEFGPLITAIIIAGRTSSAFTAQIGTMQVNQEIDALRTMGLSPMHRLVIPKLLGLIIAMPLLVVWADAFGLFGGMLVAKSMLGISFYNFLVQFPQVIEFRTFLNGLIKAPIFAVIIASIGCFEGFNVSSTADSVGRQTTKSVVESIFLIIVADAVFSIILPWQGV